MFYETAQTVDPGWHGKTFKPSHYDDLSWTNPTSASRHFRSPGSSPTIRRRIIDYDDEDESEPHMFQRRSPSFDRKFFKDVWNDHPRREDLFDDRPSLFKRTVKRDWDKDKRDWDKDVEDFENSLRRDRDFRNEDPEDGDYDGSDTGRVHHIPIMVERRRGKMNDEKPYRSRCSSPPPPPSSLEQEHFVDESDEWLRNHMNRLKQNFDSGFSTMQNRRHRLPRVDLNSRPRAFTSPIPDWGLENVHTLPTRKPHSRVFLDEKRNPKSVFRSYSETHEDIPREHPTASRSHSDSHCPKTAYVTKVNVNVSPEKAENVGTTTNTEESSDRPVPPRRRSRYRPQKEESEQETETEQVRVRKNLSETSATPDDQTESKTKTDQGSEDVPKTAVNGDSKTRKNSLKDGRGANALLQISSVLQNVEDLVHHVEAYNGNGRDKQFRFLDEMLTRCMLRLDDVDTDGLEDVRNARKAAVRQVQACIEKLESRATEEREKEVGNNKGEKQNGTEPAECVPDEEESKQPSCGGESNQCPDDESKTSSEESKLSSTSDAPSNEEGEQTRL